MENNQLPAYVQERIKADAWKNADEKSGKEVTPYRSGYFYGYIAGATAENSRAQELINALEEIERRIKVGKALQQWKEGKEVGNG